jgi:hypothetical protein
MVTPPVTLLSNRVAYYMIINHAGTVQVLAISYLSHYHFSSTHNGKLGVAHPSHIQWGGLSRGQTKAYPNWNSVLVYQCCPSG